MALETMERYPEGVRELVGMGVAVVEGLVTLASRVSPRFRAALQGSASRWPATERLLAQLAAAHEGMDPELAARLRQQATTMGAIYDAVAAKALQVELAEMLGTLSEEELYALSHQAQQHEPPNVEVMQLAVGELNRRAAEVRKAKEREARRQQGRSGVPATAPRPDLHVVEPAVPPPNGGQLTTIPVTNVDLYEPAIVPSQRETLTRAWGVPATGPLWPTDPTKVQTEAVALAQADRRPAMALATRRRLVAPATTRWWANRRREIRGFEYRASQAAIKAQRAAADQAAIDRQFAAAANREVQQAKERIDELERALHPAWLSGRRLSHQEWAEAKAELAYERALLEQAKERAAQPRFAP